MNKRINFFSCDGYVCPLTFVVREFESCIFAYLMIRLLFEHVRLARLCSWQTTDAVWFVWVVHDVFGVPAPPTPACPTRVARSHRMNGGIPRMGDDLVLVGTLVRGVPSSRRICFAHGRGRPSSFEDVRSPSFLLFFTSFDWFGFPPSILPPYPVSDPGSRLGSNRFQAGVEANHETFPSEGGRTNHG